VFWLLNHRRGLFGGGHTGRQLEYANVTEMDLGTFSNGLTAITVRADEEGVAKATYTASGGVIADVSVLVGSPLASGQVSFFVFVTEPTVAVSKP